MLKRYTKLQIMTSMNYFNSSRKNPTYILKRKSVMELHGMTKFTNLHVNSCLSYIENWSILKFSNLMAFWFLQLKQVKWSQNRKWNYTKQIFPKLQYTLRYHYATFKKYNCLKMMIPMNRIYLIVLGDIKICCIWGGWQYTTFTKA